MPAPVRVRILTRNPVPEAGLCVVLDNGQPCASPMRTRGLCGKHYGWLLSEGRVEELGLPIRDRRYDLRPNPDAPPGICTVQEAGVPCTAAARRRGICLRHYAGVWQRPDLSLDDFARREARPTLSRKRRPVAGACVVQERSAAGPVSACTEAPHARGLCALHYKRLAQQPALFDVIADPPHEKSTFRVKKNPASGLCVIIQDDVGCSSRATSARRLCSYHYGALSGAGLLHALTDPFKNRVEALGRRPDSALVEGFCRLTVNGVPCTNVPRRRGICLRCHNLIEKTGADLEALADPVRPRGNQSPLVRKTRIIKGVCLVIEAERPCSRAATVRGLCHDHYRLAARRKVLHWLALSSREIQALPDIPHFYLDKNVVIDFVRAELFHDATAREAVALIRALLAGKLLATVSLDCVRAVYSYVGHRLARPPDDGGRGLTPADAESSARDYVGELFYGRGGLWHLLPFTTAHVELCATRQRLPGLSLEDALEVHLFAEAKSSHGCALLVTSDRQVLDVAGGAPPRRVLQTFETLARFLPRG